MAETITGTVAGVPVVGFKTQRGIRITAVPGGEPDQVFTTGYDAGYVVGNVALVIGWEYVLDE